MPDGVEVRRILATEASRVRALRLEALADPDAGIAFHDDLEDARQKPDDVWIDHTVGSALGATAAQFVAERFGTWIGSVTMLLPEAGSVDHFGRVHPEDHGLLVGVYVAPAHRGFGLLDDLVSAAVAWAGTSHVLLDVHERNVRAQAAYRRLGFAPTGRTWDGPHGPEIEMVR